MSAAKAPPSVSRLKRVLFRIGVTHQAHREVIFGPIGDFTTLSALHFGQLTTQLGQAISGQTPVNLELVSPVLAYQCLQVPRR